MAWERAIDRLMLRQIHMVELGDVSEREIRKLIQELLDLSRDDARAWFHVGYARTFLGLDLEGPGRQTGRDEARWYQFGRFRAHSRKGESHWMAELVEDETLLLELASEPAIASQILPSLMDLFFKESQYEKAAWVLSLVESQSDLPTRKDPDGHESEVMLLLEAALCDLITRLERTPVAPENRGSARRALMAAMGTRAFEALTGPEQARLHRALGKSLQKTGEWTEAHAAFDAALELDQDSRSPMRRSVLCLQALNVLKVTDLHQLEAQAQRESTTEALALFDEAMGGGALPEACFGKGILFYEQGAFAQAAECFDTGTQLLREQAPLQEELFNRSCFYLGASLLGAGNKEEVHKAVRHIEETIDKVQPELVNFYPVYDSLKEGHQRVALRFLDALDLGRGTSADDLLLVALEYQGLGEPEPALKAAERVLHLSQDLDQRVEALKIRLSAHNMQGRKEDARQDYFEIRDLLLQRGAFEEVEMLMQNEALVGQALDHIEIKCELADLYEEMEGREWDRANLKLQVARNLKAKKEVEDLQQALAILREVEILHPDLAHGDLVNIEKLLALKEDPEDARILGAEAGLFAELGQATGHKIRILVVGGNERQRKHHDRLWDLAEQWGFEADWLQANYASPQKTVATIRDRIGQGQLDLLILLHWNRHETTEPALEFARADGLPARILFYAGFTSLQVGILEMAHKLRKKVAVG